MKVTCYEYNGKLYKSNERVTLTFNVSVNCIELFLKKCSIKKLNKNGLGYTISEKIYNKFMLNKNRDYKTIKITLNAVFMYKLLLSLGFHDWSEIRDNIDIYRYEFDKKNYIVLK